MRLESDTRSGEGAGQGLGFEDGQGRVNVITLQRPPCERQPGNHRLCELSMDAQRHIVPRVVREDRECQLRRACSLGSPIEPLRSVVLKVTARTKWFAIHRHTAARAITDASESAHDNILALTNRGEMSQQFACVIVACGILLTTGEVPAAGVADISASISPIGLGGPSGQRVAYLWLDLRNQGARPQALCGDPSVYAGDVGIDSGWRLVGSAQAFTFL